MRKKINRNKIKRIAKKSGYREAETKNDKDHSTNEKLTLDMKMSLKNFINDDLSTIIDSIIQISNGEFHINEQQPLITSRIKLQFIIVTPKHCWFSYVL